MRLLDCKRMGRRGGEAQFVVVATAELQAPAIARRRESARQACAMSASVPRSSSAPDATAAKTWPRSASSPSLMSMAALARPRKAMPAAMRGVGRSRRWRSLADISALRAPLAERAGRIAERAGDPDIVIDSRRHRDAAPSRWHQAMHGDVIDSGPRVVSPPTSATPMLVGQLEEAIEEGIEPVRVGTPAGSAPACTHAGSAPIAARSLRFTASAFQPMSCGRGIGREMHADDQRVGGRPPAAWPAGTCSSAASSPMPSTTSARGAARAPDAFDQVEFAGDRHRMHSASRERLPHLSGARPGFPARATRRPRWSSTPLT